MDQLIKKFPSQLREAIDIGEAASIRPHHFGIHQVVLVGMGGSAIGGAYVADLIADEAKCPYIVCNSYTVPAYVDKHTLVIVSSYSGNTEESISALEMALTRDAKVVCMSSGGKLKAIADRKDLDFIALPSGWPSPRACVGYSIVCQLFVLYHLRLISRMIIENVKIASDLLLFEQEDIISKADKLADVIVKHLPVIYTSDRMASVAVRWRQQINENAKMLAWHHVLPEMNHNELVGWKQQNEHLVVIFLRYKDDLRQVQLRTDLTKKIITPLAHHVIEIFAKGQSMAEKMMYMTHLGDWLSWSLAQKNHVDASEIDVIDTLKRELESSKI